MLSINTLTDEELTNRYATLPTALKETLDSEITIQTINAICEKYHIIDEEKILITHQLSGLVLLGFIRDTDLANELHEFLELNDKQRTTLIAGEINQKIFSSLRDLLQKNFRASPEESLQRPQPSPKPPTPPAPLNLASSFPAQSSNTQIPTPQITQQRPAENKKPPLPVQDPKPLINENKPLPASPPQKQIPSPVMLRTQETKEAIAPRFKVRFGETYILTDKPAQKIPVSSAHLEFNKNDVMSESGGVKLKTPLTPPPPPYKTNAPEYQTPRTTSGFNTAQPQITPKPKLVAPPPLPEPPRESFLQNTKPPLVAPKPKLSPLIAPEPLKPINAPPPLTPLNTQGAPPTMPKPKPIEELSF